MRIWGDIADWQARRPGMGNRRTRRAAETATDEGHATP